MLIFLRPIKRESLRKNNGQTKWLRRIHFALLRYMQAHNNERYYGGE
jgi:hypothetical protein